MYTDESGQKIAENPEEFRAIMREKIGRISEAIKIIKEEFARVAVNLQMSNEGEVGLSSSEVRDIVEQSDTAMAEEQALLAIFTEALDEFGV